MNITTFENLMDVKLFVYKSVHVYTYIVLNIYHLMADGFHQL